MKDKDRKYNELIGRIKAGKPEPDDSQLLISEILSAIHELEDKPKSFGLLKYISWVSSVAAVLLLGLFLDEICEPIASPVQKLSASNYHFPSLIEQDIEEDSLMNEISRIVIERRELQKKRETFYMNIVNKH
jgi:hypothetical protein